MTPTQRAQAAHKQRMREAGRRPVTVWLSADAHARLADMAKAEGSNAAVIERLVMKGDDQ